MSPERCAIELLDVEQEADAIADAFEGAHSKRDVRTMRHCVDRLIRNHRKIVHILTELCEEVALLKGAQLA